MDRKEQYNKLYQRSLRVLSSRQRTESQIRDYLNRVIQKEKIDSDLIEEVISQLKRVDYINDSQYISDYVDIRTKNKQKGKRGLIYELQKKGIKSDAINTYFANNSVDEEQLAKMALYKVWGRYRGLNKFDRYKKTTQYLLRRGFDYEVVRKTIEEFEESE